MAVVTLAPKPAARHSSLAIRARSALAPLRAIMIRSRRHGMWIAAWSVVGWVGTALAPALANQPFVLMMLSPRALFVALASNSVPLIPFVLLGTLRLSVTDASYFIIGRSIPQIMSEQPSPSGSSDRFRRMRAIRATIERISRWFCARPRLAALFLFFRPNGKYLGIAGAYGVSPWVAGVAASAGTASFLTAMHLGLAAAF